MTKDCPQGNELISYCADGFIIIACLQAITDVRYSNQSAIVLRRND
jgi:hypothetical protein